MTDQVAFIIEGYNRYSIAALAGLLEQELPHLPVVFLQSRMQSRMQSKTRNRNGKNGHGEHPSLGDQVRVLAAQQRRLVVAHSFMTPQLPQVLATMESLRPRPDNVLLVAGGPHPSGDPLGTLEMGFDVVVVGEGELAFPKLLQRIFAGESYHDVPGLACLQAGGHGGGTARLTRLRRKGWADLDAYPPFSIRHNKLAAIEVTRGCPWACSFCQTPFFLGGKMRYRSLEAILYWLRRAREERGMRYARFISADIFCWGSPDGRNPDLEQVEKLLHAVSGLMGRENTFFGSFPSEVRPGSVSREGMALIKKYCVNDNVVIGAQSGSNRMLKQIHRGHTIEQVFAAAEIIVAAGLKCIVDFIFGLPGETAEDRALSVQAMERLAGMGAVTSTHFFIPLAGTPLAQAQVGVPGPETLEWLERATSAGAEIGRWKGRLRTVEATVQAMDMELLPALPG